MDFDGLLPGVPGFLDGSDFCPFPTGCKTPLLLISSGLILPIYANILDYIFEIHRGLRSSIVVIPLNWLV